MKRKAVFSVAESPMKKRKLDSPITTAIEAQPQSVSAPELSGGKGS